MPWNKSRKKEKVVLKQYAIRNGISSIRIFVTNDVESTADVAREIKKLKWWLTNLYYQVNKNSQITKIVFLPSTGNLGWLKVELENLWEGYIIYQKTEKFLLNPLLM